MHPMCSHVSVIYQCKWKYQLIGFVRAQNEQRDVYVSKLHTDLHCIVWLQLDAHVNGVCIVYCFATWMLNLWCGWWVLTHGAQQVHLILLDVLYLAQLESNYCILDPLISSDTLLEQVRATGSVAGLNTWNTPWPWPWPCVRCKLWTWSVLLVGTLCSEASYVQWTNRRACHLVICCLEQVTKY